MSITLTFKNLRDEVPEVNKSISFYVAKNPFIMIQGGFDANGMLYTGACKFDWWGVSSEGAMSCCYDYDDPWQNSKPIGYETKFLEDGESDPEDEYETYKKLMYLDNDMGNNVKILPFESDSPKDEKDIEIFWEYTHKIQYDLAMKFESSGETFPVGFIKPLMEDGMLEIVGVPTFLDVECRHSGYKYKHVTVFFKWLNHVWKIKGSQEGVWEEDAWLDGKYAEMFVYDCELVGDVADGSKTLPQ